MISAKNAKKFASNPELIGRGSLDRVRIELLVGKEVYSWCGMPARQQLMP